VKKQIWLLGLVALIATGAVLLARQTKQVRGSALHFVDGDNGPKNFDAFPPEIPDSEFEGIDFFS
jgi:hypothetical protein